MRNYQLEEITTRAKLRSQLANHFRSKATEDPRVVDLLLFKGQAEAHELMAHYTQRHHLARGRAERGAGFEAPPSLTLPRFLVARPFVPSAPQISRYVAPAGGAAAGQKTRSAFMERCAAAAAAAAAARGGRADLARADARAPQLPRVQLNGGRGRGGCAVARRRVHRQSEGGE